MIPASLNISLGQGVDAWRASCAVIDVDNELCYQYQVSAETPEECLSTLLECVKQNKWTSKSSYHVPPFEFSNE